MKSYDGVLAELLTKFVTFNLQPLYEIMSTFSREYSELFNSLPRYPARYYNRPPSLSPAACLIFVMKLSSPGSSTTSSYN